MLLEATLESGQVSSVQEAVGMGGYVLGALQFSTLKNLCFVIKQETLHLLQGERWLLLYSDLFDDIENLSIQQLFLECIPGTRHCSGTWEQKDLLALIF